MSHLFVLAAHNSVVALVLALFVFGLTRVWCNPPVAHVLWLLVLLKLIAPPLLSVDWPPPLLSGLTPPPGPITAEISRIEDRPVDISLSRVDRPTVGMTARSLASSVKENDHAADLRLFWSRGRHVLTWLWLGGASLFALVAARRIMRFERLLRDTLPASARLQRVASEIAGKLGVRRVPDVRYAECVEVPLLWCAGRRPTVVLPLTLIRQLDDQSLDLILAHELAHLRRRDHWVRGIELIVTTVYWWNPLVRLIRRQIHQSEEVCCDAWVRWAFPDCTNRYAEVVLKTAESLKASQVGAWLLPASPFLRPLSLKARIEMILESRFAPGLSTRSTFVLAMLTLLVLPSFVRTTETAAWADSKNETAAAAREPDNAANSGFPYAVRFEQGATRLLTGDQITILEIRGTADTFTRGNIYLIKGSYTLASHARARLDAYITAMDTENAKGSTLKVQTSVVAQGKGTFTLYLPMSCRGWPHVSFYPEERGESFGGNYFGTGDSVLKHWWGSSGPDHMATGATPASSEAPSPPPAGKLESLMTSGFPHAVRFEQGATQFLNGDKITLLEVRGTADRFAPGNVYSIKGTYTLASHDRAMLAAYVTAMDSANGTGSSHKFQTTTIDKGDGTFTLFLPMSCRGWPHVSFYPAEGGGDFGGNYFGTGDSVLKRWWGSN